MSRFRWFLMAAVMMPTAFSGWQWWTAPRVDPRLIGRWVPEIDDVQRFTADGIPIFRNYDLSFLEDGRFFSVVPGTSNVGCLDPCEVETTWSVRSSILTVKTRERPWGWKNGGWNRLTILADQLRRFAMSDPSAMVFRNEETRYRIVEAGPDQLILENLGPVSMDLPERTTYTRLQYGP